MLLTPFSDRARACNAVRADMNQTGCVPPSAPKVGEPDRQAPWLLRLPGVEGIHLVSPFMPSFERNEAELKMRLPADSITGPVVF
jgi:hypothetical protein